MGQVIFHTFAQLTAHKRLKCQWHLHWGAAPLGAVPQCQPRTSRRECEVHCCTTDRASPLPTNRTILVALRPTSLVSFGCDIILFNHVLWPLLEKLDFYKNTFISSTHVSTHSALTFFSHLQDRFVSLSWMSIRFVNIARIVNAVQFHSLLSGNKDYHEFRFSIVRIVINVSKVTSLQDCSEIGRWVGM